MLDQRVAGQRADDEDARRGRFEHGRQFREGKPVVRRKFDTTGLDKAARRRRTDSGDQAVAAGAHFAVARVEHHPFVLDGARLGLCHDVDPARIARRQQRLDVGILGRAELGTAVHQRDDIALRRVGRQPKRIFDAGITAAKNEYMLVVIGGGIVELVLDMWLLGAGAAQQIGVALGADGEDDRIGNNLFAAGGYQLVRRGKALQFLDNSGSITVASGGFLDAAGDRIPRPGDRLDLGIQLDIDLGGRSHLIPDAKDGLALARFELQAAAGTQDELRRRCHHMLALLILVDRVGQMVCLFEQHVADPEFGRMRSRAQTSRS